MRRTTLKDVGDHVGVSAKTVSNVINGTGWVRDDLKARVREAIDELGYRPNSAARQLRSGRSGMIALAIPDLSQPYFAELASAIVAAAADRSITVLINQTNGQADAERRISDGVGIPVMDGLILSPLALTAGDLADRQDSTPIVLLGEHVGESRFPHVTVENAGAARAATDYLLRSGRRRIAAIGAQATGPRETSELRLAGYRAALREAGIAEDPALIREVIDFRRSDGVQAIDGLLAEGVPFDGVFAFNDLMALGALHALGEAGLRVPEDVAVIGFDDIEEGRYSTPPLTTVAPDKAALGSLALELLLSDSPAAGDTTVPYQIVSRMSA
ncbi:LacI family transcriptional regulator [Leifsonia shinshuensis]|uniref:LacI family DNA-binding transcriptional regulator n=1 Tax=Leifsonia shinshuensis TaxID=150026 RepID=UPI001F51067F|nr:LacI family DNA-binding transcriptional regulator [Leifsonia shinshuensis]MCI0156424.1 LacI family transcriptional regulator [Leifsonia shinshuensis]